LLAGIGTYPAEGPVNVGWFRGTQRSIGQVTDQMFATTFDSHVIAGYKFVMRYYDSGDRIYIFGFSRGAFTARFLARMISHVGLLSRGNEEMVPFAYKVFQDYEKGVSTAGEYMRLFKRSFCRNERSNARGIISASESGIKPYFLGLFDCVNSVGNLDLPFFKTVPLPKVHGSAEHIRHAVAIDERRVKFKPALLSQDEVIEGTNEDIKEVWFPGNHGDIGGGWAAELDKEASVKHVHEGPKGFHEDKQDDQFQLSDITLKWMIDEIDQLEEDRIAWDLELKKSYMKRFELHRRTMIQSKMHDTMTFGGGLGWPMTLLYKIMGM
jgi:uncharacterized protein (DUF2235 family)